jgi:2-dehydropantoate 2-reductase
MKSSSNEPIPLPSTLTVEEDEHLRILVVGAGAVGGYFGGRLAQAGRDVTFLVHARRAEEIRASGLQIISAHGDVTIQPKLITASELRSPYDIVLLSVKNYALTSAINDFAPAVGPSTVILPVLNGMRHMDFLEERFGNEALLGGVCLVATQLDANGRIVQLADFQSLAYGELDGKQTPRLRDVDRAMRGAGFDASVSDHIVQDMWQKWVQLASLGAITCLLRGNIREIVAVPGGADLSLAALRECAAVAAACGYPPSPKFLEEKEAEFTAAGSSLTSSMYRDLVRNAPVEVDSILGDLLTRGHRLGISTPILQAACVNLSMYQRARKQ